MDLQTLHILNKPPGHPRFRQCLALLGPHDMLLLTEDAVLALAAGQLPPGIPCRALASDLQARGLHPVAGPAEIIDYADMVALTIQAHRVISW